jgi:hypothetical protein
LLISPFETTACTTPDKPNPKINGHKISQNMANVIQSAWPISAEISMSIFKLNRLRDVRSPDQRGLGFGGYFIFGLF